MKFLVLVVSSVLTISNCCKKSLDLDEFINSRLDFAAKQYKLIETSIPDNFLPRSINETGEMVTSNSRWRCFGFYLGTLCYLSEPTRDEELRKIAKRGTMLI